MTAAQKRTQAKVEYDALLAGCPSRQLLARISDTWVALVRDRRKRSEPEPPTVGDASASGSGGQSACVWLRQPLKEIRS